jgi:acyl carrier protein
MTISTTVNHADTDATQRAVVAFLKENFVLAGGEASDSIPVEQSLTQLGLVDSTGVLEIIAFLESTFGITVKDEETVPDNLDSVQRIVSFVARKQGGA